MIPDPHPLNVQHHDGGTWYARGVLYEIAAACFYEDEYNKHDGSMISFWATRTPHQRSDITHFVNKALDKCSR